MKKRFLSMLLCAAMALGCVSFAAAAEEKPVIKILTTPVSQCQPMAEMTMFNDAAAAAGVTLEWIEVRSGWDEKKVVTLASSDLPDIFLGCLNDSDVAANIDLFADMTDLIDHFAPNVQAMWAENPDTRLAGVYNGAVYSIPLVMGYQPHSYTTLNINKTWLDKLGLAVPTTLDELEQVMIAFRDGDPNGNGIADEIGFDYPPQHAHDIYALTGAFGVVDCLGDNMVVIQDGKISFLYETEAFRRLTEIIHRWYAEGLITQEVYTNDYTASNALCAQGEVARVGVSTGWSLDSRFGQFADQYICIPQLSAGEEYKRLWPCATTGVNIDTNAVVMTKQCRNPEAAMRLINELYSEDFSVQAYYGSFDTGMVTKYEDGTYSIQLPEGSEYAVIDEAKYFYSLVNATAGFFSKSLEEKTKAAPELTSRVDYDNVYADVRPADSDLWPTLAKFTEEDTEEKTYLESDIKSLVDQKIAQWVVNGGIEDEWEGFLGQLNAMGLEELRGIYQRTYDAYMSQR